MNPLSVREFSKLYTHALLSFVFDLTKPASDKAAGRPSSSYVSGMVHSKRGNINPRNTLDEFDPYGRRSRRSEKNGQDAKSRETQKKPTTSIHSVFARTLSDGLMG